MKKRKNSNYKYGAQQPKTEKPPIGQTIRKKLMWFGTQTGLFVLRLTVLVAAYFLVEVFALLLIKPTEYTCLLFGICWSLLLSSVSLMLPRLAGRIFFGVTYFFSALWTVAQTGYNIFFNRMMWLRDMFYAGEGADYLSSVLAGFSWLWWVGLVLLVAIGVALIWKFPKQSGKIFARSPYVLLIAASIAILCLLPESIFLKDQEIWGTRSEYGQSSSYRATYTTMYDAKKLYNICGTYHLTFRDVWKHHLYPLTPAYRSEINAQVAQLDDYFAQRGEKQENEMTGIFQGKNVILVLMESMDDWMITPQDTPTLSKLMDEGINFTNFYTPGYGTARTINSEFCMNTGIYLPTNGQYVFNYVTNDWDQAIAAQMANNGYTSEVFHYNTPEFYSRGAFEPAMGYNAYHCYADYNSDKDALYDDCLLFDIPELNDLFFREGQTFNTIITRSAHLSYKYNEVLSHYALKQYPQYRGLYGSEEEDCARVKAKLVDDMFARLLQELEEKGQLHNTVIIGMTDHYTYGYKNTQELLALSGVEEEILLEKTPCFIWASDGPAMDVEKTLNTADLVPTVLNLVGIDSPYNYLGQDTFDPRYVGYALFPDGSWASEGVFCKAVSGGEVEILENRDNKEITGEYLDEMATRVRNFITVSNLLLTADYYNQ